MAILFFVLCWITVSLRTYCRWRVIHSFGIDDKLLLVLMIIYTAYLSLHLAAGKYGPGRHAAELSAEDKATVLKYWYICELLYIVSTCLLKLSVGFLLLRITIERMHVHMLRILMLGTVLSASTHFFMVMFQCRPIPTFWNENPRTPGKCWNDRVFLIMTYTAPAINCLADWAFGILPIFIVWSLNMQFKSKILVMLILGFAAIGSTATIVRIFYLHHLIDADDFLWSTTDVAIWTTVEPGIGIAAASIATLRPLWQLICYRAGLSSEAPANLRWRERNCGKRTYIRSEGSGSKRTPRLRPDIDTSLKNITIEANASPRLSAASSQAGVAYGATQPLSPLTVERMAVPSPRPEMLRPSSRKDEPDVTSPTVDWNTPRISALTMGSIRWSRSSRSSTHE